MLMSRLINCLIFNIANFQQKFQKPDPCDKCDPNADCLGSSYSNKVCKCKPGWVGDGFVCKKYDPCDACPSYTKCVAGKCVCKDNGYFYQNNDCKDKDECKLGYHNCHKHATCTNTVGGFTCKCKPGYTGDGVSCKKVPKFEIMLVVYKRANFEKLKWTIFAL